jgi:DNA-binding IclR family transcriptional regulator
VGNYLNLVTAGNPTPEALALRKQFNRLKSMVEFTDTTSLTPEKLKTLVTEIRHQTWDFYAGFSKLFFNYA